MEKWYCLNSDGKIYIIGNCENFDQADIQANLMGLDAIWIIDEQTANQWRSALHKI